MAREYFDPTGAAQAMNAHILLSRSPLHLPRRARRIEVLASH